MGKPGHRAGMLDFPEQGDGRIRLRSKKSSMQSVTASTRVAQVAVAGKDCCAKRIA